MNRNYSRDRRDRATYSPFIATASSAGIQPDCHNGPRPTAWAWAWAVWGRDLGPTPYRQTDRQAVGSCHALAPYHLAESLNSETTSRAGCVAQAGGRPTSGESLACARSPPWRCGRAGRSCGFSCVRVCVIEVVVATCPLQLDLLLRSNLRWHPDVHCIHDDRRHLEGLYTIEEICGEDNEDSR